MSRLQSFIPLFLAGLGLILFGMAINVPLFEWDISEIVTDPPYDIHFTPSPWITKFGDSLKDGLFIFHQFNGSYCGNGFYPENLNSMVRRSQGEETIERITQNINHNVFPWLWLLLILCGTYIWWYAIFYKRPVFDTIISTVGATIFLCIILGVTRPFYAYTVGWGCLEGSIRFTAKLSKIHYETLLVLFMAIVAEIAAVDTMLRQIVRALVQRKERSKLTDA